MGLFLLRGRTFTKMDGAEGGEEGGELLAPLRIVVIFGADLIFFSPLARQKEKYRQHTHTGVLSMLTL